MYLILLGMEIATSSRWLVICGLLLSMSAVVDHLARCFRLEWVYGR